MDVLAPLRDNLGGLSAYGLLALVLLVVGFLALEIVTPGSLRSMVWVEHRRNAVILTVSMVIALSLVILTGASVSGPLALWRGLLYTAIYGIVAIALLMFSFVLIDWLTPGKLGSLILDDDDSVAGWVSGAVFVGLGAVMAAGIWA